MELKAFTCRKLAAAIQLLIQMALSPTALPVVESASDLPLSIAAIRRLALFAAPLAANSLADSSGENGPTPGS